MMLALLGLLKMTKHAALVGAFFKICDLATRGQTWAVQLSQTGNCVQTVRFAAVSITQRSQMEEYLHWIVIWAIYKPEYQVCFTALFSATAVVSR